MAGTNCGEDRMIEDVSAGDLVCGIYTSLLINVFSMCGANCGGLVCGIYMYNMIIVCIYTT
jgi:hypothetical protein